MRSKLVWKQSNHKINWRLYVHMHIRIMFTCTLTKLCLKLDTLNLLLEEKSQLLLFNIYHKTAQMFGAYSTQSCKAFVKMQWQSFSSLRCESSRSNYGWIPWISEAVAPFLQPFSWLDSAICSILFCPLWREKKNTLKYQKYQTH